MNLMKQEKKGKFTLSSTSKKIFFSIFMMCLHGNKRKKSSANYYSQLWETWIQASSLPAYIGLQCKRL
jgi:hypothetical protein